MRRRWSAWEDEFLLGSAGQLPIRAVAKRLKRSYGACLMRLSLYGVRVGRQQGYLSARDAADEYGVPVHRVQRWAAAGRLKARRGPHTWLIDVGDMERKVRQMAA